MSKSWPAKDPVEVLDFGFDWLPKFLLPGEIPETATTNDSILTVVATVVSGTVVVDRSNVNPGSFVTTTWLSGGEVDEECFIDLTITTEEDRVFNQLMKIKIKDK